MKNWLKKKWHKSWKYKYRMFIWKKNILFLKIYFKLKGESIPLITPVCFDRFYIIKSLFSIIKNKLFNIVK